MAPPQGIIASQGRPPSFTVQCGQAHAYCDHTSRILSLSGRRCNVNFRDDRTVLFALEAYFDLAEPCLSLDAVIPTDISDDDEALGETVDHFVMQNMYTSVLTRGCWPWWLRYR